MLRTRCAKFDLKGTLESGQLFRYQPEGKGFRIEHGPHSFLAAQHGDHLHFAGISRKDIRHFFSLDEDYNGMLRRLGADLTMRPILRRCAGIRIMKQDPWECLVAFVCSQNSNIPRIKQNLAAIRHHYGTNGFPRPEEMQEHSKLVHAKLGYREKFIRELSRRVDDDWLEGLKWLPYDDAKEKLCTLPGVGEKVADCVLLFSLGHRGAFPVDVWMEKALEHLYGIKAPPQRLALLGRTYFGKHAGYAQQFIYHWARTHRHIIASATPTP